MRGFEEQRAPRWLKLVLNLGALITFLAGLAVGMLLGEELLGVVLIALGTTLFAVRGYLRTRDKILASALIFVAVVVLGIAAIVHFLGP